MRTWNSDDTFYMVSDLPYESTCQDVSSDSISIETLTADPPAATVPAAGGKSTHKLNNHGTDRLAFKVKSSNNADYTVKPVFGFVEPGASTDLEITRKGGAATVDKMSIQFEVVPGTDRLAFKVKPSNNADYTVKHGSGFVEPGGSADFEITRKRGAAKEDKKMIQFAVVPADATDAKTAFAASTVAGSIFIAVSAT